MADFHEEMDALRKETAMPPVTEDEAMEAIVELGRSRDKKERKKLKEEEYSQKKEETQELLDNFQKRGKGDLDRVERLLKRVSEKYEGGLGITFGEKKITTPKEPSV